MAGWAARDADAAHPTHTRQAQRAPCAARRWPGPRPRWMPRPRRAARRRCPARRSLGSPRAGLGGREVWVGEWMGGQRARELTQCVPPPPPPKRNKKRHQGTAGARAPELTALGAMSHRPTVPTVSAAPAFTTPNVCVSEREGWGQGRAPPPASAGTLFKRPPHPTHPPTHHTHPCPWPSAPHAAPAQQPPARRRCAAASAAPPRARRRLVARACGAGGGEGRAAAGWCIAG